MVLKKLFNTLLGSRNSSVEVMQAENLPNHSDGLSDDQDEAALGATRLQFEKAPDVSIARRAVVETSEDADEMNAFDEVLEHARSFLMGHRWCTDIVESRIGMFVPRIVSVFLFRIDHTEDFVDEWLWIVVGDVPPGYLVTDYAPNAAWALNLYIGLAKEWVDAVKEGKPVVGLYPINVPPTLEWAEQLDSRLRFLEKEILKDYMDDLVE
ncbi:hypothetical protein EOI86_18370 [Hwanghaeella grinnelliae]|uniref:Uncharacterized protein n=1 Tax=Hwanghaeella grinnelliae TaxID=2500179 RepID=A0A3S3UM82_9PROT|nr:hypothetical protein [Hwanghaeella grinnelliae]RVU34812.1 hypothetical protein EOI86_18370 [Hwanghaeella grinnelliae]